MSRYSKSIRKQREKIKETAQPDVKKVEERCSYCNYEGHSMMNCPLQQYNSALSTGIGIEPIIF